MKQPSNLAYSNNPCCAFMAAIVGSFEEQVGGQHYLGRTAMQKLVYFAKALGAPIPCSFEIYTYGPYSERVTFAVDSLLADDVLKETSNDPQTYSNYRLGQNAGEILSAYRESIEPYRGEIDAVVQSLGRFEPPALELIATLHFIHHRLMQIGRKEPSKAQVVEEFRRVKKDKFSAGEIDSWYDALKRAKLT